MHCVPCSLEGAHFELPNPASLRGLSLTSLTWEISECNDARLEALCAQGLPLATLKLDSYARISEYSGTGLGVLSTLTSLTLEGCGDGLVDSGMAAIRSLPLLERLKIDCGKSKEFTQEGLAVLRGATRLQYLTFDGFEQVNQYSHKEIQRHQFLNVGAVAVAVL